MAPLAEAITRRVGAKLTLLHVLAPDHYSSTAGAPGNQPGALPASVKGRLDDFQRQLFSGLDVTRICRVGETVEEIVAFAHSAGADLIVMPSHGRTRFRELLLGSVTAGVLHDSHCPVLTAAHAETAPSWNGLPEAVLCAIDLSPSSVGVLAAAQSFAAVCGAALRVVHVLPPPTAGLFGEGALLESEESQRQRAMEDYVLLARQAGVVAPFEAIRAPTLAEAVIAVQKRDGSGLLVIGRGTSHGVLGRLRASAHELIRRSASPVLSV